MRTFKVFIIITNHTIMQKFIILLLFLSSCGGATVKQIGKINQISNRNIDAQQQYTLLEQYAGSNELKKANSITVEDAIDALVKQYPGGEFLRNVRIYLVNNRYFGVEGDIWGTLVTSVRGFQVNDKVIVDKKYHGIITQLKGDRCTVKFSDNKAMDVMYERVLKM